MSTRKSTRKRTASRKRGRGRRIGLGTRILRALLRGIQRTGKDMASELIPRSLRKKRKGKSAWTTETVRRTHVRGRTGGGGGGLGGGNPAVTRALNESGWGPVRSSSPRRRGESPAPSTAGRVNGHEPSLFSREASDERQRWRAGQTPAWQRHSMPDPEEFEQRARRWDREARAEHGIPDVEDPDDDADPGADDDTDPSSAAGGAV